MDQAWTERLLGQQGDGQHPVEGLRGQPLRPQQPPSGPRRIQSGSSYGRSSTCTQGHCVRLTHVRPHQPSGPRRIQSGSFYGLPDTWGHCVRPDSHLAAHDEFNPVPSSYGWLCTRSHCVRRNQPASGLRRIKSGSMVYHTHGVTVFVLTCHLAVHNEFNPSSYQHLFNSILHLVKRLGASYPLITIFRGFGSILITKPE